MNTKTIGAPRRPKLSLPFGGRRAAGTPIAELGSGILSGHELRRLVAEMVD